MVLCDVLDGWDGEGVGREVQEGGDIFIHVHIQQKLIQQKLTQHIKATIPQDRKSVV